MQLQLFMMLVGEQRFKMCKAKQGIYFIKHFYWDKIHLNRKWTIYKCVLKWYLGHS